MISLYQFRILFVLNALAAASVFGQVNLGAASFFRLQEPAVQDLVYDSKRDVLYGTVDSAAGFPNGNSIADIDPATGNSLSYQFIGSEPNQLAIDQRANRLLVGIDGAGAVRGVNLRNRTLGPLSSLTPASGDASVAEDIAFQPGNSGLAVISVDNISSSASGKLVAYQNDSFLPGAFTADQSRRSGGGLSGFRTRIESAGQNILGSNGVLVNIDNLTSLGQFNVEAAAFEVFPELGLAFALEGGSRFSASSPELIMFDLATFLEIDRLELSEEFSGTIEELFFAGQERLGFLTSEGEAGIIAVPGLIVPIPEPSTSLLAMLFAIGCLRRKR
jgi:hypothetical protein